MLLSEEDVRKRLTSEQITYLQEHFAVDMNKDIADELGISRQMVRDAARALDLVKSKEAVSCRCSSFATLQQSLLRAKRTKV